MNADPPDSVLILASLGEPDRFGDVFRRHYPAVYAFMVRAVGRSDGPDLAAEVFVRAFASRRRYDPNYPSARPWLMGIAANLVAGYYRSKARENRAMRRTAGTDEKNQVGFEDDTVARLDAAVAEGPIQEALGRLRREEVEVLSLFVLADFTYAEIAQSLNIPEGTVRSRLSRARARLRNLLAESGESKGHDGND